MAGTNHDPDTSPPDALQDDHDAHAVEFIRATGFSSAGGVRMGRGTAGRRTGRVRGGGLPHLVASACRCALLRPASFFLLVVLACCNLLQRRG